MAELIPYDLTITVACIGSVILVLLIATVLAFVWYGRRDVEEE
ncbi:MAG: hypothetical protein R3272_03000 [Candidatus Promineifilaceae bacterium]|nr:hypothetical protein [Candidatus Promineifilaceae bacterium]